MIATLPWPDQRDFWEVMHTLYQEGGIKEGAKSARQNLTALKWLELHQVLRSAAMTIREWGITRTQILDYVRAKGNDKAVLRRKITSQKQLSTIRLSALKYLETLEKLAEDCIARGDPVATLRDWDKVWSSIADAARVETGIVVSFELSEMETKLGKEMTLVWRRTQAQVDQTGEFAKQRAEQLSTGILTDQLEEEIEEIKEIVEYVNKRNF
ncbi:hypothetical protein B0T21DRAFT_69960 [Apiosordaria backusii]|uniref:Uncharacterized protein n=1 Tax=Apiosordaria backusii TaxID=314023 RepID=A0AA40DV52_9PEZI|nr:hypothetical protein B0T21DRAFT_69960 [Apiosordaria backusii]